MLSVSFRAGAACAAAALLFGASAAAAPKLPVVADEALSAAEKLLGTTTGDDRLLACIDALPFLEIVTKHAWDYAYAVGLHAECLYLTEAWEPAASMLGHYLELVPESARKGPVKEKVTRAEQRMRHALMKLGRDPAAAASEVTAVRVPKTPEEVARTTPEAEVARPEAVQDAEFVPPPDDFPPPPPEPAPEQASGAPPAPAAPIARAHRPRARPEAPSPPPQFAVRAGWSMHTGGVGVGAELRLGWVAIALGSGGFPLSGGLSFGSGAGRGGPYLDVHAAVIRPFLVEHATSGFGAGATVGWDWRPIRLLSVKLGVGAGYDSTFGGPVLAFDASAGPVFSF